MFVLFLNRKKTYCFFKLSGLQTPSKVKIKYSHSFHGWYRQQPACPSNLFIPRGQSVSGHLVQAYGVPFPPKFNVPFYIVLCIIYPTFCVFHLSLHSRFKFLHPTFNFDLCNIQVFAFDIQLFISSRQVFEFDLQVQWDVHSLFRIQHLAFVL